MILIISIFLILLNGYKSLNKFVELTVDSVLFRNQHIQLALGHITEPMDDVANTGDSSWKSVPLSLLLLFSKKHVGIFFFFNCR